MYFPHCTPLTLTTKYPHHRHLLQIPQPPTFAIARASGWHCSYDSFLHVPYMCPPHRQHQAIPSVFIPHATTTTAAEAAPRTLALSPLFWPHLSYLPLFRVFFIVTHININNDSLRVVLPAYPPLSRTIPASSRGPLLIDPCFPCPALLLYLVYQQQTTINNNNNNNSSRRSSSSSSDRRRRTRPHRQRFETAAAATAPRRPACLVHPGAEEEETQASTTTTTTRNVPPALTPADLRT